MTTNTHAIGQQGEEESPLDYTLAKGGPHKEESSH